LASETEPENGGVFTFARLSSMGRQPPFFKILAAQQSPFFLAGPPITRLHASSPLPRIRQALPQKTLRARTIIPAHRDETFAAETVQSGKFIRWELAFILQK
jgi:hypothetical protein